MARTLLISNRTQLLFLVGGLAVAALVSGSCGGSAGTTGYTDPFTTTRTDSPIIDAATLIRWTDEGKVNAPLGTAGRVVVVSVTTPALFVSKGHIPDAFLLDYPNELTMTREEGLGPATVMVLSGPRMDALVQRLGIDAATTVVLTVAKGSSDGQLYQMSVAYFTFRYWGFSRDRVKILNGGDDAWDFAGQPLMEAALVPTPSAFSVSGNRTLNDVHRTSVGEMLAFVDSVNRDPRLLDTWQMLDVRGYSTSPYVAHAYRGAGGFQFVTDRVGGESGRNRLYPDRDTLISRMASFPVKDGTADAFLSPSKKMLVMCGTSTSASPTFVLFDAVLGVPDGDVTLYDGSSSQWNQYSMARISAAGASGSQAQAWAFDARSPGSSSTRASGPLPAPVAGENPFVPGNFVYPPSQSEVNQIEAADRAYMSRETGGGGGASPGGGGGSTGGGC